MAIFYQDNTQAYQIGTTAIQESSRNPISSIIESISNGVLNGIRSIGNNIVNIAKFRNDRLTGETNADVEINKQSTESGNIATIFIVAAIIVVVIIYIRRK